MMSCGSSSPQCGGSRSRGARSVRRTSRRSPFSPTPSLPAIPLPSGSSNRLRRFHPRRPEPVKPNRVTHRPRRTSAPAARRRQAQRHPRLLSSPRLDSPRVWSRTRLDRGIRNYSSHRMLGGACTGRETRSIAFGVSATPCDLDSCIGSAARVTETGARIGHHGTASQRSRQRRIGALASFPGVSEAAPTPDISRYSGNAQTIGPGGG
jgi:hypothetical protein